MHRWRSLRLTFPTRDQEIVDIECEDHSLDERILNMLKGPTPNLKKIELIDLLSGCPSLQPDVSILPNLSGLKYLYSDDVLDFPCFEFAPIESLHITFREEEKDWPTLCRLKSLRTLHLEDHYGGSKSLEGAWSNITLPLLQSLILEGEFVNLQLNKLDLPSLEFLSFRLCQSYGPSELPVAQLKCIELYSWGDIPEG